MPLIQLASEWEDQHGRTHQPDDIIEVPSPVARRLIYLGQARHPQQDTPPETAPEDEPASPVDPRRTRLAARKDKAQ